MEKEFNLSEKVFIENLYTEEPVIRLLDVKEFIKRLKDKLSPKKYVMMGSNEIIKEIDKLAGDKLNG